MKSLLAVILLFVLLGYRSPLARFPEADISNGIIKAKLLLPDSSSGYYQGTRFDWSGVIQSLEYKNHSFIDVWFKKYDPKLHDAITGPVEEFGAVGYEEAKAGERFIKIGIGSLVKSADKPYTSFANYQVANGGTWKVNNFPDRVEFTHQLKDENGYAYNYTKTVQLVKGKPQLVLSHRLRNTGARPISTTVYNHNFFLIDKAVTGPDIRIKFPYTITGTGRGIGTVAEIKDNQINFIRPLQEREDVYIGGMTGFSNSAKDYDIRVENIRSKAGIRITADMPLEKLVFWASPTIACPEPYIRINLAPGKEITWKINYEFYEMPG